MSWRFPQVEEWQENAACRRIANNDLHFDPDAVPLAVRRLRQGMAKRVCGSCPVRKDCLEYVYSLDRQFGMQDGVWGGMTLQERRKAWKKLALLSLRAA